MRCVKTRKGSIPSRSIPTGCLFSPLSSWKPLERAHTHVRCISASSLSIPPITCLSEGLPEKMAAFQTAHSARRDNALIAEVRRPRAQQKFRHASDSFSICILVFFPPFLLDFALTDKMRERQTPAHFEARFLSLFKAFFPPLPSLFYLMRPIGEISHGVKYCVANICL